MFSVISIKTSSSNPQNARLVYLKLIQYNQAMKVQNILETFVNPELEITSYITQFSGIGQNQLQNAPKFFQIAKQFIEMTQGQILIANQMSFVYQVIKNAFKELGFSYSEKNLDIDLVMNYLKLPISKSVFEKFEQLVSNELFLEIPINKQIYQQIRKPIELEIVENLPEQTGVYYFFNKKNKLIYVGKSVNIKKRVQSHLSNQQTKKAMDMKAEIHQINYQLTGNELLALLLESNDIKKYKPKFNKAQKRNKFQYGLFEFYDKKGYLNFVIEQNPHHTPITTFSSLYEGQDFFLEKMKKNNLCQCLSNLYKNTSHTCFLHQINECEGASLGKESPENYNQKAIQVINEIRYPYKDFLIVEKGRSEEEKAIIYIKEYQYQGFGYVENIENDVQKMIKSIKKYPNNKDIEWIIQGYLKQHEVTYLVL